MRGVKRGFGEGVVILRRAKPELYNKAVVQRYKSKCCRNRAWLTVLQSV